MTKKIIYLIIYLLISTVTLVYSAQNEYRINKEDYQNFLNISYEFRQAEGDLNATWRQLMSSLSQQDFESLKKEQQLWISERDRIAFNNGSKGSPEYMAILVELTKGRANELKSKLQQQTTESKMTPQQQVENNAVPQQHQEKQKIVEESNSRVPLSTNNPQTMKSSTSGTKEENLWLKVAGFIVIILIIIGLFFGLTNRAVFYMNMQDLSLSFVPFVSPIVGLIIAHIFEWNWVVYLGVGIGILGLIYVFYKSYQHNQNIFYAVTVGIAKLCMSFLWIVSFWGVVNPSGKTISEKRYNRTQSLFILSIVSGLIYKLVNGEKVLLIRHDSNSNVINGEQEYNTNQDSNNGNYSEKDVESKYKGILNITNEDTPNDIKNKYRELLAKYHPDKVEHLGVEFQKIAEEKTKEIIEAYRFYQNKYNFES